MSEELSAKVSEKPYTSTENAPINHLHTQISAGILNLIKNWIQKQNSI